MDIRFHTLGCKVNQYETQAMMALAADAGHTVGEFAPGDAAAKAADALVINSCTVTAESDRKLRQLVRRCRRDNPGAVLAVTGCMPQAFPEAAAALEEADVVMGNADRHALLNAIADLAAGAGRRVDIPAHGGDYETLSIHRFAGRTRAFVKIEDGCNRFCSYCIIPYARGRVRSRPLDDLTRELEALAADGHREAVLVGINLTAYGQDLGLTVADAVEAACAVEGIDRVRLGSIEPDHLTPAVIDRLAAQKKLCPQFHLSLQSGCDATLRRMRRHYTAAEYAAVCDELRRAFPGCALTTDVMVGFPGEDEEEFSASLDFVRKIGFFKIHVFPYSRRPGTPAAKAPDQVPQKIKADRAARMAAAGDAERDRQLAALVGQRVDVLLETRAADGRLEGYTPAYVPVLCRTGASPGSLVTVRVTGFADGICLAEE
ncbi:MAG: tRNA (N(6)-L-threonylcarbamoyladenosine(37)-C(2))-methylthiotransferase MtaB [Acutalibacteraceae bacterium]|jgi:threonylcarbamoyladenosine tRNA methylthiotransferase MtaB